MPSNPHKDCLLHPRLARPGCTAWNSGTAAAVHVFMKQPPINDPAHWRKRAQEARRTAEQLADAVAKQIMLDIARAYDNLAELTKQHPTSERAT
jgi:hypothetical protein